MSSPGPPPEHPTPDPDPARRGLALGVAAYAVWGALPLYWALLDSADAVEILAHRVVWSCLFVVGVATFVRRSELNGAAARLTGVVRDAPKERRAQLTLVAAAVLISVNWGAYIWAVNHGQVIGASLGYFMTPLATMVIGVIALGERLRTAQWVAVGISAVAVLILAVDHGGPPWLGLLIAATFGSYGLAKKTTNTGAIQGLALETLLIAPLAIAYLAFLVATGASTFTSEGVPHAVLLVSTGVVTAVPLILFGAAAPRIRMTTLGLLQYFPPIIQFVLGLVVFAEPMPPARLFAFSLVWVALVVFTVDSLVSRRVAASLRSTP